MEISIDKVCSDGTIEKGCAIYTGLGLPVKYLASYWFMVNHRMSSLGNLHEAYPHIRIGKSGRTIFFEHGEDVFITWLCPYYEKNKDNDNIPKELLCEALKNTQILTRRALGITQ